MAAQQAEGGFADRAEVNGYLRNPPGVFAANVHRQAVHGVAVRHETRKHPVQAFSMSSGSSAHHSCGSSNT